MEMSREFGDNSTRRTSKHQQIQDMVLEDRRLTEKYLLKALDISLGTVSHI